MNIMKDSFFGTKKKCFGAYLYIQAFKIINAGKVIQAWGEKLQDKAVKHYDSPIY